jgi:exopolysaccharide production protein ExoQ
MSAHVSVSISSAAPAVSRSTLAQSIGFFFAFRIFFVLLTVRIFGQDAQVGVVASLAVNYLLLLVAFFCSAGQGTRSLSSILTMPGMRWVEIFFCFTAASLCWSATSSMAAAAAFWCAMAADAMMVILLLRTGPMDAMVSGLMKGYVWGACLIATIAWLLPSQSDLRLGDEELLGPNQIGYACAFAFFFVQYLMREEGGGWKFQAILLGLTLLRSLSKTTIVAFLVAQAFILARDRSIKAKTKWLVATFAIGITLAFSGLLTKYYDVYTNAGNQSETLTGRLGLWAYFFAEAIQTPWLGHGFHSVWKIVPVFGPDMFQARHAHNEVLQQFYAYGVVGVVMLIGIYGSVYRRLLQLEVSPQKVLFIGMLLFVLIHGLADTEPFDLSLPMWTIVMIAAVTQQLQRKRRALS